VSRASAACFCLLVACSGGEAPQAQKAALSAGVVARVDGEPIHAETVAAIARAQGVSTEEALRKATFDALVAREARARGFDRSAQTEVSAQLASLLIAEVAREARAKGEPTDDELGPFVEGRWWELNRPDGVVVAQIVVQTPKIAETDPATDEAALAIARKVRAAVAVVQPDVRKSEAPDFSLKAGPFKPDPIYPLFQDLGLAVEHEGFQLSANAIPPFGADGYVQKPGELEMVDQRFVKGAFALEARGDLSEPVRSDSGWHVILMLGKTKGYQAPRADLLARFGEIVVEERARNALADIVARGRKEHDAAIERNTDELTLQVKVGR
jgi:hypothetical protein